MLLLQFDPARRWLKELKVTIKTDANENWFCGSNPWAGVCAVRAGNLANITSDTTHLAS